MLSKRTAETPPRFKSLERLDPRSVQYSTGHVDLTKRADEARFILTQFSWYEVKFIGKNAEFIENVINNLEQLAPHELFRLRDVYLNRRKLFDASFGNWGISWVGKTFELISGLYNSMEVVATSYVESRYVYREARHGY